VLIEKLRALDPDVVFLQEVNPVVGASRDLSSRLGMEAIHQVSNAGIKVLSLGIPSNLTEGMTILARPSLDLEEVSTYKLSGSVGIYGDALTIHFDETIVALVGRIVVAGRPIYLVNVHLSAAPPADPSLERRFRALSLKRNMQPVAIEAAVNRWRDEVTRRENELTRLTEVLKSFPVEIPVIIGGDFNAEVSDPHVEPFLRLTGFRGAMDSARGESPPTWDPEINENIAYSTRLTDAGGDSLDAYGVLKALDNGARRSIDHILLSPHWGREDVRGARVVFDEASAGVHVSDHFGVLADLDPSRAIARAPEEWNSVTPLRESTFELLPILSYDTDAGLGFGVKVFALNFLKAEESFDLVLFGSTKGERWGRFVFSIPDFELRQGKLYPFALDLAVDYDKWISYGFFGVGNRTRFDDREHYTRTPLDVSLTASHGFTRHFVGQVGVRYLTVTNGEFEAGSRLQRLSPEENRGRATATSFFLTVRTDTRDSYINPSRGLVTQCDLEVAPKTGLSNVGCTRVGVWGQGYCRPFLTRLVLAARIGLQGLSGGNLPVQMLLPIGGNKTVRGSVQDRYLDRVSAVANLELRFPVFWRFGGILGYDAGKVWHNFHELDLSRWATNPVAGLRFHMDTFVVRLDVGFGKETTGFYLNFGHIF
jgi:endonuclease/exonuclease/phosphatase family metal-dependent hydrolase